MSQQTPPHVAFFATHLPVGGVQRMLVNITGALAEKGWRVDLVLVRKEGEFLKLLSPQVNVIDLGSPGLLKTTGRLAAYLRAHKPDALLATGLHRNVFALLARRLARVSCRVVLSERVVVSRYGCWRHTRLQTALFHAVYRVTARLLFPKADAIFAVSEEAARDLERYAALPDGHVKHIYNPFITPLLTVAAHEPVDHPWFSERDRVPVLLSVGRFDKQKDYATLLHAFARVREQREARLVLVGDGLERGKIEALRDELSLQDHVAIFGFDTNPFRYMSKTDLFILSSIYEGAPNVLVEALGCGAPVLATDCPGGIREILGAARYGDIVPMRDAEAMAAAILAFLEKPDGAKTERFLRERAGMFTLEESVKAYARLLLPDAE